MKLDVIKNWSFVNQQSSALENLSARNKKGVAVHTYRFQWMISRSQMTGSIMFRVWNKPCEAVSWRCRPWSSLRISYQSLGLRSGFATVPSLSQDLEQSSQPCEECIISWTQPCIYHHRAVCLNNHVTAIDFFNSCTEPFLYISAVLSMTLCKSYYCIFTIVCILVQSKHVLRKIHHCTFPRKNSENTFSFITAHFVLHCTLKQALGSVVIIYVVYISLVFVLLFSSSVWTAESNDVNVPEWSGELWMDASCQVRHWYICLHR